ncbi:TPA: zf-HC2 domain-containing protein [Aeromonas hydrophila subsp. hydrophila]|uniref:Zf-HC2 domain-containing protein n=3 Tax=Gammaproteobacteria TaxID=1236 RepID=A0A7T3X1N3_AERCA|nr:zf-HC2 domain-containing protein [Klebsiella pneumoniae]QQA60562.1 zf-HC2 domain-containing protein [Aeromonas caviae]HDT5863345.1 zf-HC2 domain-containing protein [Aeromonas hydrophila subsp. hydrophila]HDT5894879.1 zf-HC2 domain-containing protein [Aeromonas hydrophila subsp. hydrophila]
MMNCLQATRLLSEAMDRPLTWQEQARLKVHLGMCRGCRQFSQQMPVLRRISRIYAQGEGGDADPGEFKD